MTEPDWVSRHHDAVNGGQEMKAMARSLVRVSTGLRGRFNLLCPSPSGEQSTPVSKQSLNSLFQQALSRAGKTYTARARRTGLSWKTGTDFVDAGRHAQDRQMRGDYLKLLAWQRFKGPLLEALCLAVTLADLRPKRQGQPVLLFRRGGPIALSGQPDGFIWAQPKLPNTQSGLAASPDILLTERPELSNPGIRWILECKCRQKLASAVIRGEFGKAFDLGAPSYTIVSYYDVPRSLEDAAIELGINLEVFALGGRQRDAHVEESKLIERTLAGQLRGARDSLAFARLISRKSTALKRYLG